MKKFNKSFKIANKNLWKKLIKKILINNLNKKQSQILNNKFNKSNRFKKFKLKMKKKCLLKKIIFKNKKIN